MNRRAFGVDALVVVALVVFTGLFALVAVNFRLHPMEDAAMLMRYADHLASGKGVVWNLGERPLDGATDFLFMVFVAALRATGLALETSVRLLDIASHFATVVLVYLGMRKLQRSGRVASSVSAAYFAVGPGLFLSAAYFGTPFFVLTVTVSWLLAQRLILSPENALRHHLAFSLACLVMGLTRPEGVLIAGFMLLAVVVSLSGKDARAAAVAFFSVFAVLGGVYFLWRWSYFGQPLPNPYYKKGSEFLYPGSLVASIAVGFRFLYPFIPVFPLALRDQRTLRLGAAFAVPLFGTTLMWGLLSNEMNFGGRFQYPLLALAVLSWYPLVKSLRADLRLPRFSELTRRQGVAIILVTALVGTGLFGHRILMSRALIYESDGLYDMAMVLQRYSDGGYTLATTEAGLLPLYSRWRSIDTWGLNDRWIAHHGMITEDYLREQTPDVIMIHAYFSPGCPLDQNTALEGQWYEGWNKQTLVLKDYAERGDFTLAAVYGVDPSDTHYYYVRPDIPDHDALVRDIRAVDYTWGGVAAADLAGSR